MSRCSSPEVTSLEYPDGKDFVIREALHSARHATSVLISDADHSIYEDSKANPQEDRSGNNSGDTATEQRHRPVHTVIHSGPCAAMLLAVITAVWYNGMCRYKGGIRHGLRSLIVESIG